ncbi:MAG TPA: hypothetical protein VI248_26805 [Kineosporiaceae bacterium]
MADARGAWNETGDKLTELGRKLKVHYEAQRGPESEQSRQELADAARRMGGALQDTFEALGTAARDKAVQADVRQVGHSLLEALGATLGQASEELRRALAERKGEAAGGSPPASRPGETPGTPAPSGGATPAPPEGGHVEPWGTP